MLQNIWSMQLFFLFPSFFEEQQTLPTRWVCKNNEVMHDLVGAHLVMLVTDWKSSILSLFGSVGLEGLRCIDFSWHLVNRTNPERPSQKPHSAGRHRIVAMRTLSWCEYANSNQT